MINIGNFVRFSGGKFVTVVFRKEDGSIRRLNGRIGVWKHTVNGSVKVETKKHFVVYDVKAMGYRHVAKDAIIGITCQGITVLNNSLPDHI